ncbi:hypothetical protein MFIFM68171_06298 [Madurella fahalii]|uniref:DUF6594 domain-containing protein n=1 Tax=Madurella fahalii TaxID=1157608 RepID=A0ABQ0GEB6_9PEZI
MSLPTHYVPGNRSTAGGSSPSPSVSPRSVSSWGKTVQTSVSDSPLLPSPTSPTRSVATTAVNPSGGHDIPLGWPSLANKMAETPGYESFRRFRELNVKNLLYLQVEIVALEEKLRDIENEDRMSGKSPRMNYARFADLMLKSRVKPNEEDRQQCELILKIRDLLEKYNAALLQHAKVSALPKPDGSDVEALRIGLKRGAIAGQSGILGVGSKTWGDIDAPEPEPEHSMEGFSFLPFIRRLTGLEKEKPPNPNEKKDLDLATVHPRRETDKFTHWVIQHWIPFYHKHFCSREVNSTDDPRYINVEEYSKSKIIRFTSFVTTVVACLLPTVAIVVLSTAETRGQIFAYISGFTAMFSMGLMWLTDAATKRVQVFTATAAFSAVLVVFVQNQ